MNKEEREKNLRENTRLLNGCFYMMLGLVILLAIITSNLPK